MFPPGFCPSSCPHNSNLENQHRQQAAKVDNHLCHEPRFYVSHLPYLSSPVTRHLPSSKRHLPMSHPPANLTFLSFSAGAIGIAKTVVNAKVQENGDTYGIGVVLVLSQAEVSAAIIAACVPFCRPLVRKFAASKEQHGDEEAGSGSPEPAEGRGTIGGGGGRGRGGGGGNRKMPGESLLRSEGECDVEGEGESGDDDAVAGLDGDGDRGGESGSREGNGGSDKKQGVVFVHAANR